MPFGKRWEMLFDKLAAENRGQLLRRTKMCKVSLA
jgi:hypothetical protein